MEEWRYEIKKTKMENLINDDLESSSSDITLKVTQIMRPMMKQKILIMNLAMNNLLKVKISV